MNIKALPINADVIRDLCISQETPFYIYNEATILENAKRLKDAFSWEPNFRNYFAVKATPTPGILDFLNRDANMGMDCSSLAELMMVEKMGIRGEDIMFTSNNTPLKDMQKALELGAIINLDDITLIDFLNQNFDMPELICFRYNPGPLKAGNDIIGNPEEAKYGFTREQLFEGFERVRKLGVTRFGLHTMVASNELNADYFVETARLLFELAVELQQKLSITLEFINLGGGIGIPYKPDQKAVDYDVVSKGIQELYNSILVPVGLDSVSLKMENGRVITGAYGILVTKVMHKKNIYKEYIGVDATMANLMRPGMYGAYHHITVLDKEDAPKNKKYDVVGGLCENNDKFAIDRALPEINIGDILIIHDAGAHGHAMGFNYNGKLRCAEILYRKDETIREIRRKETIEDYFKTITW